MDTKWIRAGLLVDGTGAPAVRDGAVLVRDGRLLEVGPAAAVAKPEGAEVLEYPNLTLMPGLVDTHSHLNLPGDGTLFDEMMERGRDLVLLQSAENARRALMSGVTTLRDNGALDGTTFSIRKAIERRIIQGPRMNVCGMPLTMTGGHCWPMGGEADGVEGMRQATRRLLKDGADFIKVMVTGGGTPNTFPYRASYTLEEQKAAVEEAHAWGKLTAAHASGNEGIQNALDAGFDMIVHCSFYEPDASYRFRSELARRIVDQGAWVNPTMHVNRCRIWKYRRLAEERPLTESEMADLQLQEQRYQERTDYLQKLLSAGCKIVSGSDSGWAYFSFGAFVHEAEALVSAGMTAEQVLMSSTLDAARSLGLDSEIGSLETGKLADLLFVEGDPTQDITALGRVNAVFLHGARIR